jgi:hypothetical protein
MHHALKGTRVFLLSSATTRRSTETHLSNLDNLRPMDEEADKATTAPAFFSARSRALDPKAGERAAVILPARGGAPAPNFEHVERRALLLPGLLRPRDAEHCGDQVLAARSDWTAAFKGEQYSLGNAWYTHLETGKERLYLRDAATADAKVERALPGMQAQVRRWLSELVAAPVIPRPGFCGAGVHVFLPGSPVARRGGSVHFDLEGLRTDRERCARALSFVMMLTEPADGGGLRVWSATYRGEEHPTRDELRSTKETVRYRVGDGLVFPSHRLHQIEPFSGERPRVSIAAHAVEREDGTWECWF